ncbi:isoaspartyl peptidase/L-asparaginase family protein [Cohnella sp. WQ 127256]|uniref:isoaspartyl peptidase/L-asparaginase family protein n=1 Tax=Cohnella sp. WQ 127256 TaxID=2938790 RepID=UPI002117E166|nr:isoaspartyl peptidase/L-asparaginase family protein [Cohnella sp. WQ 127256]
MSVILVHGSVETSTEPHYIQGLEQAALKGYARLEQAGSRLDAVEEAIITLENNPLFNAGLGSVLNRNGYVEVDGAIMDGLTGKFAAVAAMKGIRQAVSVARKVMENSKHVVLAGEGATSFAKEQGFEEDNCITDEQLKSWQTAKQLLQEGRELEFSAFTGLKKETDTVGCVLLDNEGYLAAASSTGGSFLKLPGRVGDTPFIGGGIFASIDCSVVCTGRGEAFILTLTAKFVQDGIANGQAPIEVAKHAIARMTQLTGEYGGLIVVDKQGRTAAVHNCDSFPVVLLKNGIVTPIEIIRL